MGSDFNNGSAGYKSFATISSLGFWTWTRVKPKSKETPALVSRCFKSAAGSIVAQAICWIQIPATRKNEVRHQKFTVVLCSAGIPRVSLEESSQALRVHCEEGNWLLQRLWATCKAPASLYANRAKDLGISGFRVWNSNEHVVCLSALILDCKSFRASFRAHFQL